MAAGISSRDWSGAHETPGAPILHNHRITGGAGPPWPFRPGRFHESSESSHEISGSNDIQWVSRKNLQIFVVVWFLFVIRFDFSVTTCILQFVNLLHACDWWIGAVSLCS